MYLQAFRSPKSKFPKYAKWVPRNRQIPTGTCTCRETYFRIIVRICFLFWKSLSEAELYHTISWTFTQRFLEERKRESGFKTLLIILAVLWIEPASTQKLHGCFFLFSLRSPWCSLARLYAVVKILSAEKNISENWKVIVSAKEERKRNGWNWEHAKLEKASVRLPRWSIRGRQKKKRRCQEAHQDDCLRSLFDPIQHAVLINLEAANRICICEWNEFHL